jgi:hypothetical protein
LRGQVASDRGDEFKRVWSAFVQQDRGSDQIPTTQRRVAMLFPLRQELADLGAFEIHPPFQLDIV